MDRVNAVGYVKKLSHLKENRMNIIRLLVPALLLALAAIPAHAQSKDKSDKPRDTVRQADSPRAQPAPHILTTDPVSKERRQKDAEQRSYLERFPQKPQRTLPPAPSNSSGSPDKGK